MGRKAKIKRQRRDQVCGSQVWARSKSKFSGPAEAAEKMFFSNRNWLLSVGWPLLQQAIEHYKTDSLIGILNSNQPGSKGDTLSFVPLRRFLAEADRFAVNKEVQDQVKSFLRRKDTYFPPVCTIWHDGQGDFVSQMMLLCKDHAPNR